jgi:hypothetical protein
LYGNLEACNLRDAPIVSNPRVAKYPCDHRTIFKEWETGCWMPQASSGRMVGKPYLEGLSVTREQLQ